MKTWQYLLVVFLSTVVAPSIHAQSRSVAVLMAYDRNQISVPTVELYRQIVDDIRKSTRFVAVPMSVSHRHLATAMPKSLGALAAFDRTHLVRAHPATRNYQRKLSRKMSKASTVIGPVQSLVDTLAIDGALLVDCQTSTNGRRLRGCGLYYYDRAQARIVGSVTKSFRVGISDGRRWAPIFVGELASGIAAERQRREKQTIQTALSAPRSQEDSGRFLVEVGVGGSSAAKKDVRLSPSLNLLLGRKFDGYSCGLLAVASNAERSVGDVRWGFQERALGFGFAVGSRALSSMEWDFGLSLAVSDRILTQSNQSVVGEGEVSFAQTRRDFRLMLQPGVLWNLTEDTAWGASLQAGRYFALTETQDEASDRSLKQNTMGMALRLQTLF